MEQIKSMLEQNPAEISTPCYFYSVSQLQQNFQALKAALGTQVILSVKANSNTDLLIRASHFLTDGVEVASIKELQNIVGGDRARYVNNPSADKTFLRAAVSGKARVIVDSLVQLEIVAELAKKRPPAGIILRLNPVVLKQFNDDHPKVRPDQFGMDWDSACIAIDICKANNLPLLGFHLFKGSYSFEKSAMATVDSAKGIIAEMERRFGQPLSFANLGGGFGEQWQESKFDFAAYREKLAQLPQHITLAHESGRGLMASIGHFAVRVRYVKQIENQYYAICDGGIAQNFLLAKTENTLRKLKTPALWQAQGGQENEQKAACTFVGSSCSKDDVIGKQSDEFVLPQPGDICIFDYCGAYNASYTVAPFLQLPQATTYIVE
ncbi:alanine racemase [Thalassomonas actiniarum]|uniref:Alanine racemase n=1 Tax=Thalassomonas actiniarum TaxID=485447 RepID=A0AAF0C6J1_9GAMM|nr:alanine racemase [Thalassomonas actiniarum]WDE02326.1 alanine racemase [Thalassomonas actiniarum]